MVVIGIALLILGYGMAYSGVSQVKSDSNNPGVGLFQAFGLDSSIGFDLSGVSDTVSTPPAATPTAVPTQTGQTPQTTPPSNPSFVSV